MPITITVASSSSTTVSGLDWMNGFFPWDYLPYYAADYYPYDYYADSLPYDNNAYNIDSAEYARSKRSRRNSLTLAITAVQLMAI